MKKIGILSYINYYNYGSMLQGYALYRAILHLDSSVECQIINYRNTNWNKKSKIGSVIYKLCNLLRYIKEIPKRYTLYKYSNEFRLRYKYFDDFFYNNCNVSERFYNSKDELFEYKPLYDIYVTGSDQTWSPIISGGYSLTPMFLDFAHENALKAAYAPSLGVTELSSEQSIYLEKKLKKYSMISCRETIGAKILSNITHQNIPTVLDPTLLLSKKDWNELSGDRIIKEPYILCYFLGDRKYYRNFVKQLSKQTQLPVYYIPVSWVDFSDKNKLILKAGPKEFVNLINNASFVCTDSFHGIAFSTNLNKNFYAFVKHKKSLKGGDNSRIYDYLKKVNLQSRLIENYKKGDGIDIEYIDYAKTNIIINKEREFSLNYLRKIITL